jgi:PII-like signaling protein
MNLSGKSVILTVVVAESDTYRGSPLYELVVRTARELGLAGATVTRGIMGYGGTSRVHTAKILRLSEDLPVIIQIVDEAENVEMIIPWLEEHLHDGIVFTSPCDVRVYRYKRY